MLDNFVFYLVFASQIFLLSYYIPRRILKQINYILEHFPASEFPKLYPLSVNHYESRKRWFGQLNIGIFILGFVVMYLIYKWTLVSNGEINQMFPWAYFMLQMVPIMLLEQSGFKQFRQMREVDVRSSRKAELKPRRFFDFVSPTLFWSTVMTYLLFALFLLYINDFSLEIGGSAFSMLLIIFCGNLFFTGIILWLIYGKKPDPYQDKKDRMRQIEYTVKPLMYVSIIMTLYAAIISVVSKYELDFIEPILMSFYCQLIAMLSMNTQLNNIRIEDINFDVYKKDAPNN